MDRDIKTITTYLGVVAAGCFFVPIDSQMPKKRILSILNKTNARYAICSESYSKLFTGLSSTTEVLSYDTLFKSSINSEVLNHIYKNSIDSDPVCVIFNGDSDSESKGAITSHKSMIDNIENFDDILKVNRETVFGSFYPMCQDAMLKEVLCTLKHRCIFHLIPKEFFFKPIELVDYLNECKVNTICWMSSDLRQISSFGALSKVQPKFIHTVVFGEETLPVKHYHAWKNSLPKARFINMYGLSECSDIVTYYEIDREFSEDDIIPIGKSIGNNEVILLDINNQYTLHGEICVRGTCLSNGYYNDINKTNKSFIQNPFNSTHRDIIYRTGDIAKYNKYGELELISRNDFQIKYMGQRIELAEIESSITNIEGLVNCACCFNSALNQIVLYFEGDIDSSEIKAKLKMALPLYMQPHKVIQVKKIPLTEDGQIDKANLFTMI